MSEQPVLKIAGGRHLLQEQVVSTYVQNDTAMHGGKGGVYGSMVSWKRGLLRTNS
jgi:DNA mismatch repair ATPase MutS